MFRRKLREPERAPEWMVVGLGNPGPEYRHTRHNIGFDVIDRLAQAHRIRVESRRHRALYGLGLIQSVPVLLVKPMTFMNLSGQAVAELIAHYKVAPERVLVVADDLDLATGRVRAKPKGGAGGHNGHRSIIQSLRTEEYPRIKVGIGKGDAATISHVLNRFHPDEREKVEAAISITVDGIAVWVTEGSAKGQTWINERGKGPSGEES